MRAKLLILAALMLAMLAAASSCKDEASPATAAPDEPHHVESIRLDTPTPAPTPEPKQVTVYSGLEQVSALAEYGYWYVSPVLTVRSGWGEAESIGAEEFGRFFVALGDERRGYPIDGYFSAEEDAYRVPTEPFSATISRYFDVSTEHLLSLPIYDAESEVFILPAEAYISYAADVYRVEESDDDLRIRYVLYTANPTGNYFESTGSCYELLLEKSEDTVRYISSTLVTETSTIPAPSNGERYLNTEISSYYLRRGMTADILESEGDMTLVSYTGAWNGIERFDRITGEVRPIAYFSVDESGRSVLVSPPFIDFTTAQLDECELRENGDVRMLVRGITDTEFGMRFSRVYTWSNGSFSNELYAAPLKTSATVGASGRGAIYDVVRGGRSIALIFDTNGRTPTIRVTSSENSIALRIAGVTLPEDLVLDANDGTYYTVSSATQSGSDAVITLLLDSSVKRYRLSAREPIAGTLPHIELELITYEPDYPIGW